MKPKLEVWPTHMCMLWIAFACSCEQKKTVGFCEENGRQVLCIAGQDAGAETVLPDDTSQFDVGPDAGGCNCPAERPFCKEDACLECETHLHCTDPSRSVCSGGTCVPCTVGSPVGCAHIEDAPMCIKGVCTGCDSTNETLLCPQTCNHVTHACVDIPRDSVSVCGACTSDAQCSLHQTGGSEWNMACMPMQFEGEWIDDRTHGFCLPLFDEILGTCPRNLFPQAQWRTSLSSAEGQLYCSPNESITQCSALGIRLNACNAEGTRTCPEGSICERNVCVSRCIVDADCGEEQMCFRGDGPLGTCGIRIG